MTASEATEKAREYKASLTLDDFCHYVQVMYTHEGSTIFYHHATARMIGDSWFAIYPEHHPSFVVHKDDARVYLYSERIPVPSI